MSADLGPSAHTSILHRRTLRGLEHLSGMRGFGGGGLRGLDSGSEAGMTERKGRDEGVLGVGA